MGARAEEEVTPTSILVAVPSVFILSISPCSLASQQVKLEATIQQKQLDKSQLVTRLSTLLPALEKLRDSSLPIQEFFNLPIDWEKEQHALAVQLLP